MATPTHYQSQSHNIQPIDLIDGFDLNFNLGNVIKYVCRAGKKDGEPTISDLNKALYYLQRELDKHTCKEKTSENAVNLDIPECYIRTDGKHFIV